VSSAARPIREPSKISRPADGKIDGATDDASAAAF
jgi:hypothetical protein